jgi:hypothetical protein
MRQPLRNEQVFDHRDRPKSLCRPDERTTILRKQHSQQQFVQRPT